jgi:hypothetical protein
MLQARAARPSSCTSTWPRSSRALACWQDSCPLCYFLIQHATVHSFSVTGLHELWY